MGSSGLALPRLGALPLGGTAVGTGMNTPGVSPPGDRELATRRAALPRPRPLRGPVGQDGLVERRALRTSRSALNKIATISADGSGPGRGSRSSACRTSTRVVDHAGKVNPVIPEAVSRSPPR